MVAGGDDALVSTQSESRATAADTCGTDPELNSKPLVGDHDVDGTVKCDCSAVGAGSIGTTGAATGVA